MHKIEKKKKKNETKKRFLNARRRLKHLSMNILQINEKKCINRFLTASLDKLDSRGDGEILFLCQ